MRALAVLICAAAYGQTVEGIVIDSVTDAPIAAVTVQINEIPGMTTATDAAGSFRLEGLKDGRYSLGLQKKGFNQAPGAGETFTVRTGPDPVRLTVKMVPVGTVSGRVLNGRGEPVAGAVVSLMSSTFNGVSAVTDKDGAFTFEVRPGSYALSARPLKDMKPPESPSGEKLGWVQTWYPGVIYKSAAAKVVVPAGVAVPAIDVKLGSAPVHRLTGTVRDAKGDPAARLKILATETDELPARTVETASLDDGSFAFEDLSDGNWQVSAVLDAHDVIFRGYVGVAMAGHDENKLDLRLSAPFDVTVQVRFDAPQGKLGRVAAAMLAPSGGGAAVVSRTAPDDAGNLALGPVYPGRYRAAPVRPSGPYYLASITMGGRDILGEYVDLNPGAVPIEVTYKSDGGTVRGSIENCGNAQVMLAPRAPELRQTELLFSGRCSADGHFEIANVRPGDYYAFAFAKYDQMAAEFLASLNDQSVINRAVAVTVRAKESTNLELRVQ